MMMTLNLRIRTQPRTKSKETYSKISIRRVKGKNHHPEIMFIITRVSKNSPKAHQRRRLKRIMIMEMTLRINMIKKRTKRTKMILKKVKQLKM